MRYRPRRSLQAATSVAVAAVLLGACSSPSGESDAVGADASSAAQTTDPGAGESSAPAPEPEPSGSPSPIAEPAGADCLVGEWQISEEVMQSYYDSLDAPVDFTISGGTGLAFTEDKYSYTPDFTLTMDIAGQRASGAATGTVTGEYTATDQVITTTNDKNELEMSIEVGGQTIDGGDLAEDFIASVPIASAPFECTPEGPVIMFGAGSAGRTPVQLTPAG